MRKLIAGLVIVLVGALAIDFGTATYAEYRVSRALRDGGDLTSDPEVTIFGFPFLTQLADGRYGRVEIRAQNVPTDYVDQVTIEAVLRGVDIPTGDLLDGSVGTVPVDELEGRVRIDATDLGRLLNVPDLEVSAPPADPSDGTGGSGGSGPVTAGSVVLTGTVSLGPLDTEVSVTADLVLEGTAVSIVASDLYFGPEGAADFTVPELLKPTVLGLFTSRIDSQELPFGITPTTVYAEGGQIVIEGTATDLAVELDTMRTP